MFKEQYLCRIKEGFNSWSSILRVLSEKKSSILWVISEKKSSILWVKFKKKSILCVIFCKKNHFLESYSKKVQFFVSYLLEKSSIRVIFDKKYFFFESHSKKKGSNSLTHFQKIKDLFFESIFKETFRNFQNKINSSSYIF